MGLAEGKTRNAIEIDMNLRNKINTSAQILAEISSGKSLEDAIDTILGKGAYMRLLEKTERGRKTGVIDVDLGKGASIDRADRLQDKLSPKN